MKLLDYTGNTIANKTKQSKPGFHDLSSLNLNFSVLNINNDKIKSGHFPLNVFGVGIHILIPICNILIGSANTRQCAAEVIL